MAAESDRASGGACCCELRKEAKMYSERYGDLRTIAAWTDGDCHLCGEPVDLMRYGRGGLFGPETATVDHLRPQSRRGTDDSTNLRMAHGGCNSSRGVRSVAATRYAMMGRRSAPPSTAEKLAVATAVAGAVALVTGRLCAERTAGGDRPFATRPALVAGALAFLVVRYAT